MAFPKQQISPLTIFFTVLHNCRLVSTLPLPDACIFLRFLASKFQSKAISWCPTRFLKVPPVNPPQKPLEQFGKDTILWFNSINHLRTRLPQLNTVLVGVKRLRVILSQMQVMTKSLSRQVIGADRLLIGRGGLKWFCKRSKRTVRSEQTKSNSNQESQSASSLQSRPDLKDLKGNQLTGTH